jgi:uncharacterized cupin superfamily protein
MRPVINLDELELVPHEDGPFQGSYGVIGERTGAQKLGCNLTICPPGGRDVAHQILKTGKSDLKYLALSTMERNEICEYPDSNKMGVYIGKPGSRDIRLMFRTEQAVDYFDRETR